MLKDDVKKKDSRIKKTQKNKQTKTQIGQKER